MKHREALRIVELAAEKSGSGMCFGPSDKSNRPRRGAAQLARIANRPDTGRQRKSALTQACASSSSNSPLLSQFGFFGGTRLREMGRLVLRGRRQSSPSLPIGARSVVGVAVLAQGGSHSDLSDARRWQNGNRGRARKFTLGAESRAHCTSRVRDPSVCVRAVVVY
ncbi:uncharacterized protein B0I36DRAFT_54563 [Microdochium trichocladiopsis]|uniref:Uncharacterized protein n=1 Tax=Microdochium trichocladiopsis TaxID=1682393 RepID=A0A9P8XS58_9PEZI|nr:uncharacterized protein B0I36DRAFT_54563 [Microdochium trichocladiopsis]KAH7012157.1 hypothetical protein B0I36DRAFT_54563 [Microdochium trichocladiopsis]